VLGVVDFTVHTAKAVYFYILDSGFHFNGDVIFLRERRTDDIVMLLFFPCWWGVFARRERNVAV
jgi:hypothetical protein